MVFDAGFALIGGGGREGESVCTLSAYVNNNS